MPLRTRADIRKSIQARLASISPQLRIDADKGPFFYLSVEAVSGPLATASADTERMALLSTLQFPSVATRGEALSLARGFALSTSTGGYARGIAYVYTTRRPVGSEAFTVFQGDSFATANSGGQVFEAIESRSLSAANADAFYNPSTRRYELPVSVQAAAAGTAGNIAARTLNVISNGAPDFDGVTNLSSFSGGSEAESVVSLYRRAQQRLRGLDNTSRGGLMSRVQNIEPDKILASEMTYANEYPVLFHRLPDGPAIDVWVLNTATNVSVTETFVASAGQDQFFLSRSPVTSLSNAFLNDNPVGAQLIFDTSDALGRSTRESSYVVIPSPAAEGDVVVITYTYDEVLTNVQSEIDGYYDVAADTGALFATDVLVRYAKPLPVVAHVSGTVLGTYDPSTVEAEVSQVVANYVANGLDDSPVLGGTRSPAELRDAIRSQVPGIASISISVFARKDVSPLVETVDVPRNSYPVIEEADDVSVSFT